MKEEDCNKTQIFYPKTKRCIKKDTKKAIEYLFTKGDKTIKKLYEMIDGKVVKKCEKPKIRNPETKRCVNPKKAKIEKTIIPKIPKVKKNKNLVSLGKKIEAIKKAKRALTPFVNRVSADIYHRNKYLMLMRRELKNKKIGCMRVYKKNADNTLSYRIGNRIILKKRIGSDSVYGIVYLSEFREKEKKIFTFASKVYEYVERKAKMELELLTKMTDIVRMELCPHFPILYGYVICDNIFNFDKDSFVKSNPNDKTMSQRPIKFPELIISKNKSKIITTFNELANGDLWNFFKVYYKRTDLLLNALIQQLLSIMFFNYYTRRIHLDTHPGNFLYHKIKAGGYFHYNLFGEDYYLENLGILWVIWDFDLSKTLDEAIEKYMRVKYTNDYMRILHAYLSDSNKLYIGYNNDTKITSNPDLSFFSKSLYVWIKQTLSSSNYNREGLKSFIINLPIILSRINVNAKNILLTEIPHGAKIINKNPYKLNRDDLFK